MKVKFFVPYIDSSDHARGMYEDIKEFLATELGSVFSRRRIFAIEWTRDGKRHYAEVGKPSDLNADMVIAILYDAQQGLYHVCTPHRGVLRGMPILVEAWSVTGRRIFDPD